MRRIQDERRRRAGIDPGSRHEDRRRVRPSRRRPPRGGPRGARGPRGDRPRHRHRRRPHRLPGQGARRSASRSSRGEAERGILVCGSGAGAAIAACKMTGIRAAICHDLYSAHQAVEHDDMNVLCLGSEIVGASVARELVARLPRRPVRRRRALRGAAREGGGDGKGDEGWLSRRLHELAARGQSVWIDLLSRELVHGGELAADDRRGRRHRAHLEPVDLPEGDRRRRRLRRADHGAARDEPTTRARSSSRLAVDDVRDACDVLRPVWDADRAAATASSRSRSTRRSRTTTDGTLEQAVELHDRVDRPNLYIKIPATRRRACRRSRTASRAASRSTSR